MKVVIFCGGFGTRMWPVSRKSYPKQFYPLINGKSFFQTTYHRFRKIFKPEDIVVSTEKRYLQFIKEQAPEIPLKNIIGEPERKDNLAAVGLIVAILEKRFPGEVMLTSWSDHFIGDEDIFLSAMKTAGEYAQETDLIVSVNGKPHSPTTQNEWVKIGKELAHKNGFRIVEIAETVKRPDAAKAEDMFKSHDFLINTGYRAWRTDIMLNYFKEFQPQMYKGLQLIMDADGQKNFEEVIKHEYHKFEKDSVEFGIFVQIPNHKSATIPTDFGWEDAGTWELFYKARRVNQNENVVEGPVHAKFIKSGSNLVIGPKGKAIGVIGLKNIAVIDTPDGLLVAKMSDTGKVKELFGVFEDELPQFTE